MAERASATGLNLLESRFIIMDGHRLDFLSFIRANRSNFHTERSLQTNQGYHENLAAVFFRLTAMPSIVLNVSRQFSTLYKYI